MPKIIEYMQWLKNRLDVDGAGQIQNEKCDGAKKRKGRRYGRKYFFGDGDENLFFYVGILRKKRYQGYMVGKNQGCSAQNITFPSMGTPKKTSELHS